MPKRDGVHDVIPRTRGYLHETGESLERPVTVVFEVHREFRGVVEVRRESLERRLGVDEHEG